MRGYLKHGDTVTFLVTVAGAQSTGSIELNLTNVSTWEGTCFTTLLIIVVILLTGCNGDQQKPPEQVEPQADTQKDVTTFPEADADTTLPTTFYPPENPYEDLYGYSNRLHSTTKNRQTIEPQADTKRMLLRWIPLPTTF